MGMICKNLQENKKLKKYNFQFNTMS